MMIRKTNSSIILLLISLLLSFLFVPLITYYEPTFSIIDAYGSAATESDNNESLAQDTASTIRFGNITNLTDNPNDSAYGQVAASGNNVYVVWQDSTTYDLINNNYDIYIKKSADRGESFAGNSNSATDTTREEVLNISNNSGFSEHPQIAAHKENVYVAWTDNTLGNKEILFARSIDNGTSFSKAINLSNTTTANSANVEIVAFENHVYAVWLDEDEGGNGTILFKASNNGGDTFSNAIPIAL